MIFGQCFTYIFINWCLVLFSAFFFHRDKVKGDGITTYTYYMYIHTYIQNKQSEMEGTAKAYITGS